MWIYAFLRWDWPALRRQRKDAGHEVRLLDLLVEKDPRAAVAQAIQSFNPEAIGVSVRNIDDQRMRNTKFLLDQARDAVAWCKEESAAPIILGGAGFSILPRAILNYLGAEMGIQGEGETIFPELLRRIHAGEKLDSLPGLFRKGESAPARRTFARNWMRCRCPIRHSWRELSPEPRMRPSPFSRGADARCRAVTAPRPRLKANRCDGDLRNP